ncbi:hypothetical protein RND81_06G179400 [Saponaria officinalis]|uniref:G protein gamma domain-containing protein n=1 Tax=Saponaria officinalis TaxID=3572 RepID=A0AAW1KCZ2_SAPOF
MYHPLIALYKWYYICLPISYHFSLSIYFNYTGYLLSFSNLFITSSFSAFYLNLFWRGWELGHTEYYCMAGGGSGSGSGSGSATVHSLPPPRPKSPPDLYGRRKEIARLQLLERERGHLEEELKFVEGLQPASRSCKEIVDYVSANSDPIIPINKKIRKSCRLRKWLCGSSCANRSWCCCCTGCSIKIKVPDCCCCSFKECCSCMRCSLPKCRCWCNPCFCCCTKNACCCSFKSIPCSNCCRCNCKCSCPKCPSCSDLCGCFGCLRNCCCRNFCCFCC